ncbi:MAG: hypothetical protein WBH66_01900 [Rectinemataceae bacterium]
MARMRLGLTWAAGTVDLSQRKKGKRRMTPRMNVEAWRVQRLIPRAAVMRI